MNGCILTIKAPYGRRITSGTSPAEIEQFDRIGITLTDSAGNTYLRFFEIQKFLPSSDKDSGTTVEIHCAGIEYHTQMGHFSKQFWLKSARVPSEIVGDTYNDNKGTTQPTLSGHDVVYDPDTAIGNDLPTFTNAIYDYGINPAYFYDVWMDLVDRQGASVGAGGVFDFFELGFDTPTVNTINFRVFSSGSSPESQTGSPEPITIENTTSINMSETDGTIENQTGTISYVIGDSRAGALQQGREIYNSGVFQFTFRPQWASTITYATNAKIKYLGQHYKSLVDDNLANTPPGPTSCTADVDTNWTQIDMSDEFGDSQQYSEWTDDKVALIVNGMIAPEGVSVASTVYTSISGSGVTATAATVTSGALTTVTITDGGTGFVADQPITITSTSGTGVSATALVTSGTILSGVSITDGGTGFVASESLTITSTGTAAFDGNIVINANGFFRTWVDDHAIGTAGTNTQGLSIEYLNSNLSIQPRGYRFLNEGTGIFSSGAVDNNGVEYEDSIVEVVDDPNPANKSSRVYEVKYKFSSDLDEMQTVVFRRGTVQEWDNATTSFTDITTTDLGSDCIHKFATMQNTTSFDPKPSETDCATFPDITKDGTIFSTNINSAIEITYDFNSVISDRFTNRDAYQSHGAWFNLRFPYPISTFNSITEGVGDIYGGGTNAATSGIQEPSTLDISNMGYTPKGKLGYNQTDSTRLSKLTTFSFALGLKIQDRTTGGARTTAGILITRDGTAQMRVIMGDTKDNVWIYDFELPYTDGTMTPIDTPLSAYQMLRGHKPRYFELNNLIDLINPKDIDNQNIMEERNIKWITIQHQEQYDDFGRFAPEGNLNDLSNTSLSAALGGQIVLTIDDLHFKKALVVNSGVDTTKNLEPEIVHRQDIMLYDQAKEVADSNIQIEKFQYKEFDIMTTGSSLFDIRFGDSFYLKNRRVVSDADKPITDATAFNIATSYVIGDHVTDVSITYECIAANTGNTPASSPTFWTATDNELNTIKLVAKQIEYSISRPAAGSGAAQRRLKGVKRFTA